MNRTASAVLAFACLVLAACGGNGPVRRISEPAASIQQLTVRADGSWSVDLRINNYSTVPMRFDAASLAVRQVIVRAAAKNSMSLGLLPGQPPSM